MSRHVKDGITGIILMTFAILYRVSASGIQVFQGMGATVVSSKTIPYMWSYLLMLLSGLLIIRSAKGIRMDRKDGGVLISWNIRLFIRKNYAVMGTFLLLAVYAVMIQRAGYLISTILYLPLQVLLLTRRDEYKKVWRWGIVLGTLFTLLSYMVFVKLLSINLPKGIWGF